VIVASCADSSSELRPPSSKAVYLPGVSLGNQPDIFRLSDKLEWLFFGKQGRLRQKGKKARTIEPFADSLP
jgi:hypothetical protein